MVLSFAQPGMKYILQRPQRFCYLLNSCPAPLRNILFISLGMGEQLTVCACALVLSQLAGPPLVALALPWGHAYQVSFIWNL